MNIQEAIERLSPARQAEVMDFIEFLLARESSRLVLAERTPLQQEPFVGLWADRPEMEDGTAWTRKLRRREWP